MTIGYVRVSTNEQIHDLQINALHRFGVDRIFTEVTSGAKEDKPVLEEAINSMKSGDTLVVWKLDRIGRNNYELTRISNKLLKKNIGLISITEHFDLTTTAGKMMYGILSVMAENERNVLSERTKAGIEAARQKGRKIGRPHGLGSSQKIMAQKVKQIYEEEVKPGHLSITAAAQKLGISRNTFYKYLKT
ncbi:MAG: recombinase family protein [Bacteroides sp.]|nr:recombinase family protein [Bacteroides sp.]